MELSEIMLELHYLKYANDLSDEETVALGVKNSDGLSIEPSSLAEWREAIGKDGLEALIKKAMGTRLHEHIREKLITQF